MYQMPLHVKSEGKILDISGIVPVRSFTPAGIDAFREVLRRYDLGEVDASAAHELAAATAFSRDVEPEVLIGLPYPATKKSLAAIVCAAFERAGYDSLPGVDRERDRNTWTWLAALAFHLLVPDERDRGLSEEARFISKGDWNTAHRHRIAVPARNYWLFRHDPARVDILLYGAANTQSDWEEQICSRALFRSNRALMEVLNRLYLDPVARSPKRGAQSPARAGTLRHYISVIQQLDLTYDLQSMTPEQILDLLPPAFDRWRD